MIGLLYQGGWITDNNHPSQDVVLQEHGDLITIYSQTALGKLHITLVETHALFLVHRNAVCLDMDWLVFKQV